MVKGEDTVFEEIEQEQEDIDEKFDKAVKRALTPAKSMTVGHSAEIPKTRTRAFALGLYIPSCCRTSC